MQQGAVGFCTEHHLFILKEEEGEEKEMKMMNW